MAEEHAAEIDICGCPTNEFGDIRCHVCGEYVNKCCWNCRTPRGEGTCPNPTHIIPSEATHCANCGGEVPVDKPHKVGECVIPSGSGETRG